MRLTLPFLFPYHMTAIVDQHTPPVQNTWYTALNQYGGLEIRVLILTQVNGEAAAKNIEWEITIDDQVYTDTLAADSLGAYSWHRQDVGSAWAESVEQAGEDSTSETALRGMGFIYCHHFKLRYRLTSAAGTNQDIFATIGYSELRPIT